MPTFEAHMRVTHIEIWEVDARDEAEARKKISEMDGEVMVDESGGETTDWEIMTIKPWVQR